MVWYLGGLDSELFDTGEGARVVRDEQGRVVGRTQRHPIPALTVLDEQGHERRVSGRNPVTIDLYNPFRQRNVDQNGQPYTGAHGQQGPFEGFNLWRTLLLGNPFAMEMRDTGDGIRPISKGRHMPTVEIQMNPHKPKPPEVLGRYVHDHSSMPRVIAHDHRSMPDHVTHDGHLTIDPVTGRLTVGPVTGNVNLVAPTTLPNVQMNPPDRFPVVGMKGEVTVNDRGGHREANYKELYARTYLDGLKMRTERGDTPDQLDKYHADFLNGMLRFAEHFEGERELKPLTREVAGAEYDRIRDDYRRSTDYNINTRGMSRDAAENAARAEIIGKMVLGEYGSGLKGGYDPKT